MTCTELMDALVDYLGAIPVHVNLIPYNPIADTPDLLGSPRQRWAKAANVEPSHVGATTHLHSYWVT